jgi:hypothetical protein
VAITRIRLNEHSSRTVTFYLKDNAGVVVPLADIDEAELTLYDVETFVYGASPAEGIINNRDAQNVLNANNVTIHATSGLVTWAMQPDDNPIVTARRQIERHRAEFRFEVNGVELHADPIEFEVGNRQMRN